MAIRKKLLAPDISCEHCAMAIKRELTSLQGISDVSVDVSTKTITLDASGEDTVERALLALTEIGYPATEE